MQDIIPFSSLIDILKQFPFISWQVEEWLPRNEKLPFVACNVFFPNINYPGNLFKRKVSQSSRRNCGPFLCKFLIIGKRWRLLTSRERRSLDFHIYREEARKFPDISHIIRDESALLPPSWTTISHEGERINYYRNYRMDGIETWRWEVNLIGSLSN